MSLSEAMFKDLSAIAKDVRVSFDTDYGWRGVLIPKDRSIPATNIQKQSMEEVLSYLWNWVEKHEGFRNIGEHI